LAKQEGSLPEDRYQQLVVAYRGELRRDPLGKSYLPFLGNSIFKSWWVNMGPTTNDDGRGFLIERASIRSAFQNILRGKNVWMEKW
jgi:hypothetical protein